MAEDKKKTAPSKGTFGPEKTANWPALPGPKQPKDRGVGIPKIKQSMLEDV
jgi:hypothetical protein